MIAEVFLESESNMNQILVTNKKEGNADNQKFYLSRRVHSISFFQNPSSRLFSSFSLSSSALSPSSAFPLIPRSRESCVCTEVPSISTLPTEPSSLIFQPRWNRWWPKLSKSITLAIPPRTTISVSSSQRLDQVQIISSSLLRKKCSRSID